MKIDLELRLKHHNRLNLIGLFFCLEETNGPLYPFNRRPCFQIKRLSVFFFTFLLCSYRKMKVEDLLELIESSTSNSFVNKKRQKEPVDTMLDRLDQLIELSTHIYLDTNFDDQEEDRCIVSFNDMRKANEMTNSIIIKIVSCEIMFNDGKDDERIERASRILAHMSGRGGKKFAESEKKKKF